MDNEAATLIYPIIRRMSERCQLFVAASSTRYSHLANVHYGLNPNNGISDDNQPKMKVMRHDGIKYVFEGGQVPMSTNVMETSTNMMEPLINAMETSPNVMETSKTAVTADQSGENIRPE
ncbi:hypothetical protein HA402_008023 [Bradysia odoriphaga]|nr:hypothetical protein HA402_008023 [Bradysia odoriphaga]